MTTTAKNKYIHVLPLYKKYITASRTGRRLLKNNKKVSESTVKVHTYIYKHLEIFSAKYNLELKIAPANKLNKREFESQKKFWKNFFKKFCDYLYDERKCSDNYVGMLMGLLRAFFNYIEKEHNILLNSFFKDFYVYRPHTEIFVLSADRLNFLIYNKEFEEKLTPAERRIKDIFIIGCVTALRYSDLMSLAKNNVFVINGDYYINTISRKTSTPTKVKLPPFASDIVLKYKSRSKLLFTPISVFNFNKHLKNIGLKAGWVEPVFKTRQKRGEERSLYKNSDKKEHYRFCDLMSSHFMRRTAITTMLTLGVNEQVVRQISGHSAGSAEFYRYVKYSQDYLNNQTDDYFNRLSQVA
jgi:integrase